MRKTKIVCTLGPATDDPKILKNIMLSGMNVARLNFSHGTHEDHKMRIDVFKKVREETGLPIALLLDTKGPEIRIKKFANGEVELKEGQTFTFTTEDIEGTEKKVSVTYKNFPKNIVRGNLILIDDGLIACKVTNVTDKEVVCQVQDGGILKDRKSINVPGASIKMPYVSKTDISDIIFGIENDIDFVATSFACCANDIVNIRKVLEENNGQDVKIIAKIENREGVENIDDILRVSDGIMVARGDMGVEIPLEELPSIQKLLIKKCYKAGKMVITATQMLDSMIRNSRPTRAETTDVANAIYDGTSAIMLSGETAVGKYPLEAVKTMSRIAEKTEESINYKKLFTETEICTPPNVTDAISHATCTTAHDLGAAAIITVTKTGNTARMISKFRPECPIITTTTSEKTRRQLSLSWGVVPLIAEEKYSTDDLFDAAVMVALNANLVNNGDLVVITAGIPVGISGYTNILKVHLVGNVLVQGKGINNQITSGNVCVAKDAKQAKEYFKDGDILVMKNTSNDVIDLLKHAKAIITEVEGGNTHGAIAGMALNIPVITGAIGATQILKSGTTVTIDSNKGIVYNGVPQN